MSARRSYRSPYQTYGIAAAAGTVVLVWLFAWLFGPAYWYPICIAALSIVTFVAYGYDKQRAGANGGRIPEAVLHALALAGGFPGGWIGRAVFRHKTLHASFTVVLALATALHAAFALWWFVLR